MIQQKQQKQQIYYCDICKTYIHGKLATHVKNKHNMEPKIYYDIYLKHNNEGICPVCKKETQFLGITKGYRQHCSTKCSTLDKQVQEKMKQTCLNNFGYSNAFLIPEVQEKAQLNSHTKEALQKQQKSYVKTCLSKYGTVNSSQDEQIKQKIKQSNNNRSIEEKQLWRSNISNSIKQLYDNNIIQTTNLKKYGVKCNLNLPEIIQKAHSAEANAKRLITARKNRSKISKPEQYFINKLLEFELLENIDFIYQYKSDLYPFRCDFYITKLDMYIELNFYWKHNTHAFNKDNINDINTLNIWKEKANNNYQYKHAIYIWTESDVLKRNTAKMNDLNYVEIWNYDELDNFIIKLKEELKQ